MAGSKWNPATLKAAVLDLTRRHGPLTCVALRRRAAGLYDALRTRYGTITKAFEALGVPYIRPVRRWSREKVIEAIQARHRQGLALNGRQAAKLQYAARVWLGSWPAALCAAGLDSDQFRVFKRWSSQRVLEELGAWVRQHGTLNADKLARTEETLYAAAGSHFGSLEKAAQAGKLPFERLIVNWSYDKIFEEIRILKRAGQSLAHRHVQKAHSRLLAAVYRRGLTWEEAVESAGFKFDKYLKRRRWTPELLDHEVRKWVAQEGELVARALQKGNPWLYGALLNRFESLRAAAAHYGLPHRGLLESWNKERVVAAILARMREGGTLGAKAVQHQDGRLFDAAIRWHGSWGDAVRGAGIDYEQHLGRVEWTPERILERLRRWVAAHGPLSTSRLRDSDAALLGALEVRYKTVGEAARVLGLPYQPMKKIWTSGSVLAEIRALQGACTSGELRPIDLKRLDRALYFAARRRFGTVRRALEAAEGGREAGSV